MRIDIPEHKRLVHEMSIPIRWGDMDAMGHVNNAVYFRYMETARIEWIHGLGFAGDGTGEGIVIANAFCNFIRQFEHPGEVLIKTFVSPPGRSSFDTWATMERSDQPGQICATGGATVVWVNHAQQKSAPLPETLRQLLLG